MSNNIDSIEELSSSITMPAVAISELCDEHEGDLCEDNFLHDHLNLARRALAEGEPNRLIKCNGLQWRGEGSGSMFKFYTDKILTRTQGRAELVLIWESGGIDGLLVEDGKVIRCDVEKKLVPRK